MHHLKEPHLHSPGTQAGQQHQPLQEPLFLLLSQASRGRRPAPVCPERPERPKGHLGTPKCSVGCSSREDNASRSPVPESVGPPRGLQGTSCASGVPVPHHCGCRRALLSPYLTCHHPATHAEFGSFSAPQPAWGRSCLQSGHLSFIPADITLDINPAYKASLQATALPLTGSPGSPRGPGSPALP